MIEMKKRGLLIILGLFFFVYSYSQEAVASHSDLNKFLKSKTYIIKDNNIMVDYNAEITDAAKKAWYITPYEIVDFSQFKHLRQNPEYSFVIQTVVYPDKDPNLQYDFLAVLLGGPYRDFNSMPQLATFPLSYHGDPDANYTYKLPVFLKFVQRHIEITHNDPKLNDKNILKYYRNNMKNLKNKTLLVSRDQLDLDVSTLSEIKRYYPGEVKITDDDEIERRIKANDTTFVFVHIVGVPEDVKSKLARCYKVILDVNGNLYYYGWHRVDNKYGNALLKSDFIKMAKNMH